MRRHRFFIRRPITLYSTPHSIKQEKSALAVVEGRRDIQAVLNASRKGALRVSLFLFEDRF